MCYRGQAATARKSEFSHRWVLPGKASSLLQETETDSFLWTAVWKRLVQPVNVHHMLAVV